MKVKFEVEFEVENHHDLPQASLAHILYEAIEASAHIYNSEGTNAPIAYHPTRVQKVVDRGAVAALLEEG